MSELLDRSIADYFGIDSILDQADRVPSVLNGGLEKVSPVWWGFCVGLTAAIDMFGVAKSRSGDPDYFPGKLGFVSVFNLSMRLYRLLECGGRIADSTVASCTMRWMLAYSHTHTWVLLSVILLLLLQDPLGLYPVDKKGRQRMELAEIKHGRLAMIAVAGFGLQEYVSGLGGTFADPLLLRMMHARLYLVPNSPSLSRS